jgi:hypothetical protein
MKRTQDEVARILAQYENAMTISPWDLTQLAEMSDRVEAEAMRQVAERLSITEDPAPTVRPDGVLFFRGIAFGLLFTAGVVAVVLLSVYHQQILAWVREAAR